MWARVWNYDIILKQLLLIHFDCLFGLYVDNRVILQSFFFGGKNKRELCAGENAFFVSLMCGMLYMFGVFFCVCSPFLCVKAFWLVHQVCDCKFPSERGSRCTSTFRERGGGKRQPVTDEGAW